MEQNQSLGIDTHGHLISDKVAKSIQGGKRKAFQQVVLNNLISTWKKISLNLCLTTYTNINLRWYLDLSIKAKRNNFYNT